MWGNNNFSCEFLFIFSGQGINFMRKNNTGPLIITFIFDMYHYSFFLLINNNLIYHINECILYISLSMLASEDFSIQYCICHLLTNYSLQVPLQNSKDVSHCALGKDMIHNSATSCVCKKWHLNSWHY